MNSRAIPVFVHHEGRTPYAKECLRMAEKYNETVVFLGDERNSDYSSNWVNTNAYCTEEWERFKASFRNMSFYDNAYAIQIFKRLFAIKEYMRLNDMKDCVLIDSDVLSFVNYTEIPLFSECDATLFIPREEAQGSDPMSYGNLFWGASAGTSYFTYEALADILRFTVDVYENNSGLLEKKWEWHQANNHGGGVCEMTLMFLWYLQAEYRVINTKGIFEGGPNGRYVLDNDIRTVNNRCPFVKYPKKDIEKVTFVDGIPYLQLPSGELVQAVCLHFGGITKRYMKAFRTRKNGMLALRLNLAYFRIRAYVGVANFYVKYLKKYIGKYRRGKHG